MTAPTRFSRRDFIRAGAAAGGGLLLSFHLPQFARAATAAAPTDTFAPNAFLRIGRDDRITVILAKAEMGQSVWTALSLLVAEELDAEWGQVTAEHAPAAKSYFHTIYGMQRTGGSTSMPSEFDRYRQAGATARAMLVQAAAERFGVRVGDCRTEKGTVISGTRRATYGELADAAAQLPAPENVPLKDPRTWRIAGKPTRRLDAADKINGKAKYGLDLRFDGILTAVVAHAPAVRATLRSFDATGARAVAGVRDVVQVPTGVAVIADHFWAAKLGRDALVLDWDVSESAAFSSDALRADYVRLAGTPGLVAADAGDLASAMRRATRVIEADYVVPHLAHVPMEPLSCVVRLSSDRCEIWAGTQVQTLDQAAAARITGLGPDQVDIHTPFLGGSFGRRNQSLGNDFVAEAVHVARASGRFVKTVWTREDDMQGGFYRPAFVERARIGLGADGRPVAWQHTLVGQSILAGTPFEGFMKNGIDFVSVEGVADSIYLGAIPHRVELHSPRRPVTVDFWRSVGYSYNGFIMESLVDELAHAAGIDPVAYRRDLLQHSPRHLGVLNLAAEKSGWGSPLPPGHGRGIAVLECYGSYIAEVAEVAVTDGQLRVLRVVCAVDGGVAINPLGIAAQIESGIAYGLSATLHDRITIVGGRVQQSNFHDHPVLRLHEMPVVETHLVPSTERPGGIGEAGTAVIAPAVTNALFAATGRRVRELPVRL
jgi:isoquinoline 1-oxidoreductase beta subunit